MIQQNNRRNNNNGQDRNVAPQRLHQPNERINARIANRPNQPVAVQPDIPLTNLLSPLRVEDNTISSIDIRIWCEEKFVSQIHNEFPEIPTDRILCRSLERSNIKIRRPHSRIVECIFNDYVNKVLWPIHPILKVDSDFAIDALAMNRNGGEANQRIWSTYPERNSRELDNHQTQSVELRRYGVTSTVATFGINQLAGGQLGHCACYSLNYSLCQCKKNVNAVLLETAVEYYRDQDSVYFFLPMLETDRTATVMGVPDFDEVPDDEDPLHPGIGANFAFAQYNYHANLRPVQPTNLIYAPVAEEVDVAGLPIIDSQEPWQITRWNGTTLRVQKPRPTDTAFFAIPHYLYFGLRDFALNRPGIPKWDLWQTDLRRRPTDNYAISHLHNPNATDHLNPVAAALLGGLNWIGTARGKRITIGDAISAYQHFIDFSPLLKGGNAAIGGTVRGDIYTYQLNTVGPPQSLSTVTMTENTEDVGKEINIINNLMKRWQMRTTLGQFTLYLQFQEELSIAVDLHRHVLFSLSVTEDPIDGVHLVDAPNFYMHRQIGVNIVINPLPVLPRAVVPQALAVAVAQIDPNIANAPDLFITKKNPIYHWTYSWVCFRVPKHSAEWFVHQKTWKARGKYIVSALKKITSCVEVSAAVSTTKAVVRDILGDMLREREADPLGMGSLTATMLSEHEDEAVQAVLIAWFQNATMMSQIYTTILGGTITQKNKFLKTQPNLTSYFREVQLKNTLAIAFVGAFFVVIAATISQMLFNHFAPPVAALSNPLKEPDPCIYLTFLILFIIYAVALFFKEVFRLKKIGQRRLPASCVSIPARLDLNLINPNCRYFFKEEWDITDLNPQQALDKVCTCTPEKVAYMYQKAPLTRGVEYYTPTMKSSCPACQIAAAIRAMSNLVELDPPMLNNWNPIIPNMFSKIEEYCSLNHVYVDEEAWLAKFPETYRLKMNVAREKLLQYDPESILLKPAGRKGQPDPDDELKFYLFDSFTKIEKQMTTVPHHEKDSPANETKERQICGPQDVKKIAANPLIYTLEQISTKCVPGYCGGKTWFELCADVQNKIMKFSDPVFIAGDGSGFDTTQHLPIIKHFRLSFERFIDSARIDWDMYDWKKYAKLAFLTSDSLNVSVGHGNMFYRINGTRASGDGWTTWANTMLNSSYIILVMLLARITKYSHWAKGDDILIVIERVDLQIFQDSFWKVYTRRKTSHRHGMGQVAKFLKISRSIEDIDFLSAYFVDMGENQLRLIRMPARVFQLTPWTTAIKNGCLDTIAEARELCWNEGMCMLDWCEGIPIFEAYAHMLIRLGNPCARRLEDWSDRDRKWRKISEDELPNIRDVFLAFFDRKFHVAAPIIVDIEKEFNSCIDIFGVIQHEIFDQFMSYALEEIPPQYLD
jgi:hypothetical protein